MIGAPGFATARTRLLTTRDASKDRKKSALRNYTGNLTVGHSSLALLSFPVYHRSWSGVPLGTSLVEVPSKPLTGGNKTRSQSSVSDMSGRRHPVFRVTLFPNARACLAAVCSVSRLSRSYLTGFDAIQIAFRRFAIENTRSHTRF